MSLSTAIAYIRTSAESVNGSGTFVHARRTDGSLEYEGPMPQIHLYPITGELSISEGVNNTYDIIMAFWYQDKPESTNEEREDIINNAETLCRSFILDLDSNEDIELSSVRIEPNYRQLSGTLSGLLARFTLTVNTDICSTN